MRLWHKDLISILPRQQLLGQWRECCCIAKNISEKGTPNHLLVNKIMDYPIEHFYLYCKYVYREMKKRGYNADIYKIHQYNLYDGFIYLDEKTLFADWHNDRYLKQCFYNLQEKYDCRGISEEEWIKIKEAI